MGTQEAALETRASGLHYHRRRVDIRIIVWKEGYLDRKDGVPLITARTPERL